MQLGSWFSSGLVAVARPTKSAAREWNDLGRPYTIDATGVNAVISRKDQNGQNEFVEVPCDIKPAEAIRRNLAFEVAKGLGPPKKREVLQATLERTGSPVGLPRLGTLKCKKSFFGGDEEERAALEELGFLVGAHSGLDKTPSKLERANLRLGRSPPIYVQFCTLPDLPSFEPLTSSPTKTKTYP